MSFELNAKYEVELSSLNLSESQKESVMRMMTEFGSCVAETFVKGGGKGVKGRPSKSKKVVETGGESDVFEQLLSMGLEDPPLVKEDSVATLPVATLVVAPEGLLALASLKPFPKVEKAEKLAATNAKSAEKQAAKDAKSAEKAAAIKAKEDAKQAVIDAKAAKEAEKEAAKQAVIDAKAAKEAEKAAAIKAKEDAKQAVIDAKAAKEAEKAAAIKAKEDAKLAKEAEKEAKAAAKLAKEAEKAASIKAKEDAKLAKESEKESKPADELAAEDSKAATNAGESCLAPPLSNPPLKKVEPKEGSEGNLGSPAVRVKKFSFEGVKYLKDTAGTIYDLASQDRIGVWNEEDKKIVFDAKGEAEEEDECSEEEYDA